MTANAPAHDAAAIAEIDAEIAKHKAAFAAGNRSATMSPDVDAIGYLTAEREQQKGYGERAFAERVARLRASLAQSKGEE